MNLSIFNTRTKKVIRDLFVDKVRTILVVLAIAIGVFSISIVSRTRTIFSQNIVEAYIAINPAHAYISIDNLDEDLVERIREIEGVEAAEGRRVIWTRLKVRDEDWRAVKITAVSEFDAIDVNVTPPEGAAWPMPDDTIALERTAFSPLAVQLGDTVTIRALSGQERPLPIINSVHDLNSFPSDLSDEGIIFGYTTLDTARLLGVPPTYNQLWITVPEEAQNVADIHAIADAVEDQLERAGVQILGREIPVPNQHQFQPSVGSVIFIMSVLSWVALIMSSLLIINTLSAILKQQARQIGVMKTIGAPQGDIIGMYAGMVLAFSVLALCISLPLGVIGARFASELLADTINFEIQNYDVPTTIPLLEFFAALIVPLLVGLIPILDAMRITVREAISDEPSSQFGEGFLDRLLQNIPRLSATLLYAMRNIFRRKGRLILTLSALSISGGVFIAVLGLDASVEYTLVNDASQYWQQDVTVRFLFPYRTNRVAAIAEQVQGVEYTEGWFTKTSSRTDADTSQNQEPLPIFAVPIDSQFIDPTLIDGRWLQAEDTNALVINVQAATIWSDIVVGDQISLNVEGQEDVWEVVGIVTSQLNGDGVEPNASPPPVAYANYDYLSRLTGESNQADRLLVRTTQHNSLFQERSSDALEEAFANQGINLAGLETRSLFLNNARSGLAVLTIALLGLALLFGVVGGLSLTSTMSLNVLERTRELGVVRAIGADEMITQQIILYEGLFVGLISWLLATMVGGVLNYVFGYFVGLSLFQNPIPPYFSLMSIFLWLLIALGIAAVASYLPARRASRLSVREVLSYE